MKRGLFVTVMLSLLLPGAHGADTRSVDSDGDGFSDFQEEAFGANPRDPKSFPDLESKLAAWWPLDEGTGATVADVSGYARNGTLESAKLPVWTTDSSGTALSFDGKTTQVSIASGKALTPTNAFTLAAWVKLSPGASGALFLRASADAKAVCYALGVEKNKLALQLTLNGESLPLYGHLIVADGQWHYVVCAYTGDALHLYVDGVKDVTVYTSGPVSAVEGPLVLGKIAGCLRDVAVYERALDEPHVILLHETAGGAAGTRTEEARPATPRFLTSRQVEVRR
jgi:hypothetical protein